MTTWMTDAACTDASPDLFFPPEGRAGLPVAQRALATCRTCPVRQRCLDTALAEGHREGIWGGTTPVQRSELARQRPARALVGWG
jgi:WhiB family redox-sensing transcriptional regulator